MTSTQTTRLYMLCDSDSKYILNAVPYLGKDNIKSDDDLFGEFVVKTLMHSHFESKGHCVTTDNYFSSYKLATYLLAIKTTFVGTMRKNKRELPKVCTEKQKLHSSIFFEQRDTGVVLTLYQCKAEKSFVVVSTENQECAIPQTIPVKSKYIVRNSANYKHNEKQKPNTILEYNQHKAGIDAVDRMSRIYNVKMATPRWPMQVFNNILNLALINS